MPKHMLRAGISQHVVQNKCTKGNVRGAHAAVRGPAAIIRPTDTALYGYAKGATWPPILVRLMTLLGRFIPSAFWFLKRCYADPRCRSITTPSATIQRAILAAFNIREANFSTPLYSLLPLSVGWNGPTLTITWRSVPQIS